MFQFFLIALFLVGFSLAEEQEKASVDKPVFEQTRSDSNFKSESNVPQSDVSKIRFPRPALKEVKKKGSEELFQTELSLKEELPSEDQNLDNNEQRQPTNSKNKISYFIPLIRESLFERKRIKRDLDFYIEEEVKKKEELSLDDEENEWDILSEY